MNHGESVFAVYQPIADIQSRHRLYWLGASDRRSSASTKQTEAVDGTMGIGFRAIDSSSNVSNYQRKSAPESEIQIYQIYSNIRQAEQP